MRRLPTHRVLILCFLILSNISFAQEALKIMPLGNSITFDSNVSDLTTPRLAGERIAYRYKLYQLLIQEGYTFDFVGNRNAGFFHFPDGDNAGFPGIETSGLLELIRTGYNDVEKKYEISPGNYLAKYKPDIILLHIGTNGLQDNTDAENFKNDVNEILNEVDAIESTYSMEIPVFLAKIINRSTYHSPTHTYNDKLGLLAANRSGDILKVVDMENGAGIDYDLEPNGDMADTWHPGNSGYEKMAQEWFEAMEQYNFRAPVVSQVPSQQINEQQIFDTIFLDDYVFDPQERDDEISWHIVSSTFTSLSYQIITGRKLIVTIDNPQWNGTEALTLQASDPMKGGQKYYSDEVEISFTVNFINDTAIITEQVPVSIPEDASYTLSFDDLLVQDADNVYPDDFTLHIESGENYTLLGNTVTPDENFHGDITIPVRVHDGTVYSDYFSFIISVDPVNDVPVITGQNVISTYEDSEFAIGFEHLKVYDVDNLYPEDFSLILDTGANYTLNQNTVVPDENFFGTLEIPVTVSDGQDNSNTFMLSASVLSVNDEPVLNLPQTSFDEDTAINMYLTTWDADGDEDISVSLVERPSWLFYVRSEMRLYGTPRYEDVGEHEATFKLSDGKTSYDTSFILEVIHVNDPPVIEKPLDSLKTNMNEELTISLSDLIVKDSDNVYPDDFNLVLLTGNHYQISDTDGTTIKPDLNFTGYLKVKTMVNDGIDNSDVKEIDVKVLLTNDINELENKARVNVYPNPVSDYINIESRQPFESIELFSLLGGLEYRFADHNKTLTHQINATNYRAGVYILKVHFTNKESFVKKILIKK